MVSLPVRDPLADLLLDNIVYVGTGRGQPTVPDLAQLREGFEVYPVVDAIGGISKEAYRAGIEIVVTNRLLKA
jgi:hypothetical protein